MKQFSTTSNGVTSSNNNPSRGEPILDRNVQLVLSEYVERGSTYSNSAENAGTPGGEYPPPDAGIFQSAMSSSMGRDTPDNTPESYGPVEGAGRFHGAVFPTIKTRSVSKDLLFKKSKEDPVQLERPPIVEGKDSSDIIPSVGLETRGERVAHLDDVSLGIVDPDDELNKSGPKPNRMASVRPARGDSCDSGDEQFDSRY